MRRWWSVVLLGLGCNVIFEENPSFMDETDASTVDAETSAATDSAGSTETSVPMDCGIDAYEPNDNTGSGDIAVLPEVGSDEPPQELSAQIDDATDEDWFKISFTQVGATIPVPTASASAGAAMQVCIYVACNLGETVVECGALTPATSGNSLGCCGTDMTTLSYECQGAADLDGFVKVRLTTLEPAPHCIPYDLAVGLG